MIAIVAAVVAAAFAVHFLLAFWAVGQLVCAVAAVVVTVLAVRVGWWFAVPGRRLPRNRVVPFVSGSGSACVRVPGMPLVLSAGGGGGGSPRSAGRGGRAGRYRPGAGT